MRNRFMEVQRGWAEFPRKRLAEGAFLLARVLWLVVTIAGLAAFLAALPALINQVDQPEPAVRAGLERLGISVGLYAAIFMGLGILFVLGFVTVAGIIYARKTNDWMALFVAFFLVAFGLSTPVVSQPSSSQPAVVGLFTNFLNDFGWIALNGLFYLFPDWRLKPRWTWIPLVVLFLFIALSSLPANNPFSPSHLPGWVMGVYYLASWGAAIYAQVFRYRHVSNAAQRQQTKWVVYGLVMAIFLNLAISLPSIILPRLAQPGSLYGMITNGPVIGLADLLIPISMGIAVLRYRLWDIDPIINRTLVYGALTALIGGIYVLIVSALGLVFEERGNLIVSLLATALIAVLFQPVREQLQHGVNHLMYGERDEPYAVLTRLGQRVETAFAAEMVLPTIVETVAHSLKLPFVSAALKMPNGGFQMMATYPPGKGGVPFTINDSPDLLRLPLVYQQEVVGEMLLAPRAAGEGFNPADRRLLDDLAQQIGIAAHALRLTADLRRLTDDLQHSREQLILAREEERRRLRRDLHDGLGPTLAALALSASSIADLAPRDPNAAAGLAREMQQEIRASIADIRRLVYKLRPPALDELGLVAAIRDRAAQVNHSGSGGENQATEDWLVVQVEAPERLSALPAAVEVAAYRIVLEALTNVVGHARARTCTIRLSMDGERRFQIEVCDDGVGLPAGYRAGVGLISMHERAAELGGRCEITSVPGQGTRVRAELPVENG